MTRWIAIITVMLSGCSSFDVPATVGLQRPAPVLMTPCDDLPDTPDNDGNKIVRKAHYAESIKVHAECKDKTAGLQKYADVIAPPSKKKDTP